MFCTNLICISSRPETEVADVSVEYIQLPPEGPPEEEEVILVEHEPEPQVDVDVPPRQAEQSKHKEK